MIGMQAVGGLAVVARAAGGPAWAMELERATVAARVFGVGLILMGLTLQSVHYYYWVVLLDVTFLILVITTKAGD